MIQKNHVVSIELLIENGGTKIVEGKVIEYDEFSVSIMISNAIKLQFEYPSGNQIMSGVRDKTRGFCRVSSWREEKPHNTQAE